MVTTKYLGVFLDSKLKFNDHGNYVIKKLIKNLTCLEERTEN